MGFLFLDIYCISLFFYYLTQYVSCQFLDKPFSDVMCMSGHDSGLYQYLNGPWEKSTQIYPNNSNARWVWIHNMGGNTCGVPDKIYLWFCSMANCTVCNDNDCWIASQSPGISMDLFYN